MLVELTVRQFAIIKELKVNFKEGLNILTGETGAGKSIIIDAIQLITGGRGSVEFIRNESDKAVIEALFDVPENHQVLNALEDLGVHVSDDGMLLLKRELLQSGKSICRVNGQLVTLSMLREVGQWLIQLHSQHQNQHLMSQDKQLELLDAYGEESLENKKAAFKQKFEVYASLKRDVQAVAENERELAQRMDLLKYQISEISKANLKSGEDIELNEQRNKIRHSERITHGLNTAYQILSEDNGAIDLLSRVLSLLEQIASLDNNISKLHEQLSFSYYQIEDITMEVNQQESQLDFDPDQVNYIEERLSLIHHLKRKYGDTVDAILEYSATIEKELDLILNKDQHLLSMQKELHEVTQKVITQGLTLSNHRQKLAKKLSNAIEQELKELQMKNAKFNVNIDYTQDPNGLLIDGKYYNVSSSGLDKVNFLISPNPGEPLKPVYKTASGGELSRIMLAIQTILAHQDQVPTIIFDEIDTGVSGRAAQAIAEKLALVSKDKQVFVVTHLPQVASMADHHFLIQKNIKKNSTYTEICYLNEDKRIDEIARMLGGLEVTTLTKKHAKEMIEKTIYFKNNYENVKQ